mgnify:CR=1 FL=1
MTLLITLTAKKSLTSLHVFLLTQLDAIVILTLINVL